MVGGIVSVLSKNSNTIFRDPRHSFFPIFLRSAERPGGDGSWVNRRLCFVCVSLPCFLPLLGLPLGPGDRSARSTQGGVDEVEYGIVVPPGLRRDPSA